MSKLKLSKAQKEVISLMRDGWTLEYSGVNDILTDGVQQFTVKWNTALRLIKAGIIRNNQLTELGKTIEL